MQAIIREMKDSDREAVVEMMRGFYASPAVSTNGSEEIFEADFAACVGNSPYLEGYVFEENGALVGYAMLAKSFSTEFGRPCIWIEDIFVCEAARGQGIATRFFALVDEKYPAALHRLEVEPDNERALSVYRKCGYTPLPYLELMK